MTFAGLIYWCRSGEKVLMCGPVDIPTTQQKSQTFKRDGWTEFFPASVGGLVRYPSKAEKGTKSCGTNILEKLHWESSLGKYYKSFDQSKTSTEHRCCIFAI